MKKFITLFSMLSCLSVFSAQAIGSLELFGSHNSWGSHLSFSPTDVENEWTLIWDLSDNAGDISFKIIVDNNTYVGYNFNQEDGPNGWLGYAPDGYGENNFVLYNSKTGFKTYKVTATWTPNDNVKTGWKIKVEGLEHASYTVVGDPAIFEHGWTETYTDCDMTFVSDNEYCEYTTVVSNKMGNHDFKIVRQHSYTHASYPSGTNNESFYIPSNDTYEVTFYFNPDEFHVGSKVSLKVVDGNNFIATEGFTVAEATYHRDLTAYWGTLCLPFEIKENTYQGVTFYTLDNVNLDNKVLTFNSISSVAAGQPVVFKSLNGDVLNITVPNAYVSSTVQTGTAIDGWTLNGTFTQLENYNNSPNYWYFFSENKFWRGSTANMPAYRAWFTTKDYLSDDDANSAPFRISVDDTEGIQFVEQEDGTVKAYYDLQGRKLDSARKGLVIENGKIIMVK